MVVAATAEFDTDVLIVGTGPTGGAAALALATYGVSVHVITRYRWLSNTPRAHITNQRTMEVLRDLGVERELARFGSDWKLMGDTLITTSLAGEELARIRAWGTGDERHGDYVLASPCEMMDAPQPFMESVLLENALARGATASFSTEYLGHVQDSTGVDVRMQDRLTGREYTVRARYLIGADGARSQVAEDLQLPIDGTMGRGNTAYVQFTADLTRFVQHRPSILYWILSRASSHGEIGLSLLRAVSPWTEWITGWGYDPADGEPDVDDATVIERIRTLVGDPTLEVTLGAKSTWQVNEAYATEYSRGRVFCGGDAVHRHPPSGGLGSNTCIQDAFNLAWKLAFVLAGDAAESLLDSYSSERAPVGRQVVERANQSRRDFGALREALGAGAKDPDAALATIRDPGQQGVAARDALVAAVELKDYEFNAHGVEGNQRYESGAILAGTTDAEEWERDPELYLQPSTRPGAKLPHAWLVGRDGKRLSTLDIVGHGSFTLVTGLAGVHWQSAAAALDLSYLRVAVIGSPDAQDLYGEWHRRREIAESGCLLVRPDGYIAWRMSEALDSASEAEA
ncbi:MAG: 2,4-dichlorophenol 6-monooxygenase, partial [Microbacteriaceae bacterium]|nr:2,4-dichlorophenol 6-monooxygenase [Microbacteriaceae bacterium]